MHTRAVLRAVLMLAPLLLARVPAAQAQSDEPRLTFRSTADLVTIQASVRDRRGRPIGDLQPSDFDILDNGLQTPVLSLRFDRDSPVTVAILVDMSGSMKVAEKSAMARQAFQAILAQLRPGTDEVAVYSFDSELHERQPFTSDLWRAGHALDDFEPFGRTSLYDAAAATAAQLAQHSGSHKAIFVLTDGVDTSSTASAREVSALASAMDVPLYVVATLPAIDERLLKETPRPTADAKTADLRELASWSGGQFVFANTPRETAAAAVTLIGELRQQYVLAIEAGKIAEWRRLDVRIKRPSALVRARNGYFGG